MNHLIKQIMSDLHLDSLLRCQPQTNLLLLRKVTPKRKINPMQELRLKMKEKPAHFQVMISPHSYLKKLLKVKKQKFIHHQVSFETWVQWFTSLWNHVGQNSQVSFAKYVTKTSLAKMIFPYLIWYIYYFCGSVMVIMVINK